MSLLPSQQFADGSTTETHIFSPHPHGLFI